MNRMTTERRSARPVLRVPPRPAAALAAAAVLALAAAPAPAAPSAGTGSAHSYLSAPGLHPPAVRVTGARHRHAPGYVFIDPFASGAKPIVGQPGALILDNRGGPVWFHPVLTGEQIVDFTAQRYRGRPVLTWWQGNIAIPPRYTNIPVGSPEPGAHFYIYDQHYRLLKALAGEGGWTPDLHELLLTARGTALYIAAKTVPVNLTPYGGPAEGAVEDSAIQEVDLRSGHVLFQWDMLAHVPLSEAQVSPPAHGVWDPFHMNSLAEDGPAHFLISARNTSAIYEIARKDGSVTWQLGGKGSTFTLAPGASFSWQHDARPLPGDEVSLFDDACCNLPGGKPEGPAHGLVLKLDPATHTATAVHSYLHRPPLIVPSQGNLQSLPGGNVFVGWGQLPYYSEFSGAGKLLYDAALPEADESYRAFRLPWTGMPLTRPSVVVHRSGRHATLYVSWNGDTQARAWEVFAGTSAANLAAGRSAGRIVAFAARTGFQTRIPLSTSGPLFQVVAFGAHRRQLASSRIVRAVRSAAPVAHRGSTRFSGATVGAQRDKLRSGAAVVKVSCPRTAFRKCTVKLTLETAKPIKVGSRMRVLVLGSGSATIEAGRQGTVRVRLSTQALAAIKAAHGRLSPKARLESRDDHRRSARTSGRITLEEPGAGSSEGPSNLY
jgi:hypothetical protein